MKILEELDYQQTPMGELILRRRVSPSVPGELVFEVKLDDQMLMSSSVNASERALARLALEFLGDRPCDVLVGGLGLGYTASAALEFPGVRTVVVIELLAPVISWLQRRLVPMASALLEDSRCSLVEADFFKLVSPGGMKDRYDAILLDIDHSPESWLHERHAEFYTDSGLGELMGCLRSGGVFGLWSATEPADEFLRVLRSVAGEVQVHEVSFINPHLGETDSNWIMLAKAVDG